LRLEGKVALVTGASRGIGLASARRMEAEGASVCITARGEQTLIDVASMFSPESVLAIAGKADDPEHRRAVMDAIDRKFGRLDIIVNNAGNNPIYGPLMDLDLLGARKIIEVNLLSALAWVQQAYHHESLGFSSRGGSVINLSSVAGIIPSEGIGLYGVSKAAIIHLTRTLAVELGPGIRVNAVAPGVVTTEFAKALYENHEHEVAAKYPLLRLGTPTDIAAAIVFLASDDASWITGQTLTLDGGLLSAGGRA
jgi:NAD(P)-dependent dehydrogenase (short-subunit alcohol dehydrogenase family)